MWFLSARKTRRSPLARSPRGTFRPRLEALEDRCLLSAGALDTSFGTGGLVKASSPSSYQAIAVYPNTGINPATDNKIVVGGLNVMYDRHGNYISKFELVRYNPNGSLDTSFGNHGVVTTVIGQMSHISGLSLQSDGKIVAVGESDDGSASTQYFAVARYNVGGTLDKTFGSAKTGIVLTHVNPPGASATGQTAYAVAIQADGKIDVAGRVAYVNSNASYWDFGLVQYNADGSLDTTFNTTGIAVTPHFGNGSDYAYALALQSDGSILEVGYTWNTSALGEAFAVVRYTPAGVLDTSFGTDGQGHTLLIPPGYDGGGGIAALVQSDGRIVLVGGSFIGTLENETLVRLNTNGQVDTTYGNAGWVENLNLVNGHGIVQAANGDLLTAGTASTIHLNNNVSDDFGISAFLPNGVPDTTFGNPLTPGTNTVDISGGEDLCQGMGMQSDGKIVVAGWSTAPEVGELARFLAPSNTFTASPNAVTAGSSVTVYASNITDPNLTGPISQVAFYVDSNIDGILDAGDTLLGTATQNTNGTWTIAFSTTGWAKGTYTLFAQATDGVNVSVPLAISLQVT